ncbi:MAG: hypothetical protein ACOVNX_08965 [Sediminibacterium sp.]|jgi:hypothetical protein
MEVHHHTHHPKRWKEYFWEFFMLFLAVFCGFMAEIQVEHYVEQHREKRYMLSLKDELVVDTMKFATSLAQVKEIHPLLDSFYNNLKNPKEYNYSLKPKWNVYINETTVTYLPALTTILQIKNSGNLRLIKNHELLREVILYEAMVLNRYAVIAQTAQNAKEKIYDFEDKYCNYDEMSVSLSNDLYRTKYGIANPKLIYEMPVITKDTVVLNEFANLAVNYKGRLRGYVDQVNEVNEQAKKLIKLINEVYHLQ